MPARQALLPHDPRHPLARDLTSCCLSARCTLGAPYVCRERSKIALASPRPARGGLCAALEPVEDHGVGLAAAYERHEGQRCPNSGVTLPS